jgi:hypothetical protein
MFNKSSTKFCTVLKMYNKITKNWYYIDNQVTVHTLICLRIHIWDYRNELNKLIISETNRGKKCLLCMMNMSIVWMPSYNKHNKLLSGEIDRSEYVRSLGYRYSTSKWIFQHNLYQVNLYIRNTIKIS